MSEPSNRAVCNVSQMPLWAHVAEAGAVIGVSNRAREIELGETPQAMTFRDGSQFLPLFGKEPPCDFSRSYLVPEYCVEADCVTRTFSIHPLENSQ